jgi:hypothetical protein
MDDRKCFEGILWILWAGTLDSRTRGAAPGRHLNGYSGVAFLVLALYPAVEREHVPPIIYMVSQASGNGSEQGDATELPKQHH